VLKLKEMARRDHKAKIVAKNSVILQLSSSKIPQGYTNWSILS
jgi:hypothetical protein